MDTHNTNDMSSPSEPILCILIEDLLPLYLQDEVSPESRLMIDTHLATCERCTGFLAGAQRTREQHGTPYTESSDAARAEPPLAATPNHARRSPLLQVAAAIGLALFAVMLVLNHSAWPVSRLLHHTMFAFEAVPAQSEVSDATDVSDEPDANDVSDEPDATDIEPVNACIPAQLTALSEPPSMPIDLTPTTSEPLVPGIAR